MSVQRSVRFPDDLAAEIERRAGEQHRSFSQLVVLTLREAMTGPPKSVAAKVMAAEVAAGRDPGWVEAQPRSSPLVDLVDKQEPHVPTRQELAMERQRKMNERHS